ncbi:hypothetical protein JKP88DRAFT_293266 [Tribonema minus]|uniref:Uncharacterized protein n=1 Tax=Tribonema minus TaxID=303371 RepID=A0A835ZJY3_9STRA|nr:hypothetical protein JKP88DRAFT_293266 [Tribonema minus]
MPGNSVVCSTLRLLAALQQHLVQQMGHRDPRVGPLSGLDDICSAEDSDHDWPLDRLGVALDDFGTADAATGSQMIRRSSGRLGVCPSESLTTALQQPVFPGSTARGARNPLATNAMLWFLQGQEAYSHCNSAALHPGPLNQIQNLPCWASSTVGPTDLLTGPGPGQAQGGLTHKAAGSDNRLLRHQSNSLANDLTARLSAVTGNGDDNVQRFEWDGCRRTTVAERHSVLLSDPPPGLGLRHSCSPPSQDRHDHQMPISQPPPPAHHNDFKLNTMPGSVTHWQAATVPVTETQSAAQSPLKSVSTATSGMRHLRGVPRTSLPPLQGQLGPGELHEVHQDHLIHLSESDCSGQQCERVRCRYYRPEPLLNEPAQCRGLEAQHDSKLPMALSRSLSLHSCNLDYCLSSTSDALNTEGDNSFYPYDTFDDGDFSTDKFVSSAQLPVQPGRPPGGRRGSLSSDGTNAGSTGGGQRDGRGGAAFWPPSALNLASLGHTGIGTQQQGLPTPTCAWTAPIMGQHR